MTASGSRGPGGPSWAKALAGALLSLAWLAAAGEARAAGDPPAGGERPADPPPPPGEAAEDLPLEVDVFTSGEEGYTAYRIPALLKSEKGTLLAFCEGRKRSFADDGDIDIILRRSEDGGRTWGKRILVRDDGEETAGNPCPVADSSTGKVWLLFCRSNRRVFATSSADDGMSWSRPVEITPHVSQPGWTWYATGPGHGIELRSGRILVPCDHREEGISRKDVHLYRSHVIWSDDRGLTWRLGESLGERTNECTAVELEDGSVYLNMRSYHGKNRRAFATSGDGGATWSQVELDEALIEPTCQASILRLPSRKERGKSRILFSNPASTERKSLTVRLSYDECRTWPVARVLHEGRSAYSDLAVAPGMAICCLHERGEKSPYERIVLARFTLSWLTRGTDRLP